MEGQLHTPSFAALITESKCLHLMEGEPSTASQGAAGSKSKEEALEACVEQHRKGEGNWEPMQVFGRACALRDGIGN